MPAPSFMSAAIPDSPSTTRSKRLLCTYRREPAQHTCPWLKKIACAAPAAATAGSASSSTITGLLPPSSSDTRVMLSSAALPTSLPISVEPVKATLSTPLCAASAAPAEWPWPVTTLNTPAG